LIAELEEDLSSGSQMCLVSVLIYTNWGFGLTSPSWQIFLNSEGDFLFLHLICLCDLTLQPLLYMNCGSWHVRLLIGLF